MKYAIMVLALLCVLARPTAADGVSGNKMATGNQMFEWCKESRDICGMYAMGWREAHSTTIVLVGIQKGLSDKKALGNLQHATPTGICLPQGTKNGQLADVLIKYLRDHPKKRHLQQAMLTIFAFRKAFPC